MDVWGRVSLANARGERIVISSGARWGVILKVGRFEKRKMAGLNRISGGV